MTQVVDVDVIVIGAGVVGLATARALALAGREVFVLEAEDRAGEGISSRNSGVIHAGLYYPPDSLKARCCIRGRELLYAYCAQRSIPHKRLGKLIVAVEEPERAALQALQIRAGENAVTVHWLDGEQARRIEPQLRCVAALDTPDSGIVDAPELVMALVGELEQLGGHLVCRSQVSAVRVLGQGFRVETAGGDPVTCRKLVNAAGHGALPLAAAIDALDRQHIPRAWFASGHYYTRHGAAPFKRLIYPMPQHAGLGAHLGFDMAGRCRFGPDARWIDKPDYRFDDSQRAQFAASIQRWWPALREEELLPDFVGVRPKLVGPGQPPADFMLQTETVHGIPGLINLFGIESPGLTSCLALGEEVAKLL